MPTNINCQCFSRGRCLHQAAPRGWFGPSLCVLDGNPDPRIVACGLQYPFKRPDGFLLPPMRMITEVRSLGYLLPIQWPLGGHK